MMNFKDALIAHLQGEMVETRSTICPAPIGCENPWVSFIKEFGCTRLDMIKNMPEQSAHQFRIKPRTVMCNGVEVPAPESVAPPVGTQYWTPRTSYTDLRDFDAWGGCDYDLTHLERGLVYLREEHAIARAKAMLVTHVAS